MFYFLIENQNEEQSLFSDDDWSDDFEDSVDDQAVLQKVKFKDIEPALYIPFMQAVSAIYEQPRMLENFDFYPLKSTDLNYFKFNILGQKLQLIQKWKHTLPIKL